MHDLASLSPLGEAEPISTQVGNIHISERTDRALVKLSARKNSLDVCRSGASKFLGSDLPEPECVNAGQQCNVLWIAREQYFVAADIKSRAQLATQLKGAVGDSGSVIDVSDGWCRLDIIGSDAVNILERLTSLDLNRLRTNRICGSLIEHSSCYVWCILSGKEYAVYGPRSSAASLHHALATAAVSIK